MDGFNITQKVEIGRVKPGLSMGDILQELEGYSSHDILGKKKPLGGFGPFQWIGELSQLSIQGIQEEYKFNIKMNMEIFVS